MANLGNIGTGKDFLENIDIDVDIEKDIIENIDIDMGISENIDIGIDIDKDISSKHRFFRVFHILWWNMDMNCRYISIFWITDEISTLLLRISISTKYQKIFSYSNIDIDKDILENIDIDINIDKDILENIDIDMGISENIDIDINIDRDILSEKSIFFSKK